MFQVGQYVVYRKDVCKICDIRENFSFGKTYYVLSFLHDKSLTTFVPVENEHNYLRNILSLEEVNSLIAKIPYIEPLSKEDRLLEHEYKDLLKSNNHEDLVKVIKTAYLRNKGRLSSGKKVGERDEHYLEQAENYLYNEIAVSLNLSYDDTKEYIIKKVEALNNG